MSRPQIHSLTAVMTSGNDNALDLPAAASRYGIYLGPNSFFNGIEMESSLQKKNQVCSLINGGSIACKKESGP